MVKPLVESFKRFLENSRAESGMGALLIFIASILVAAVAAGVIIQSTYMAQQRAQSTAELSIQDVSDGWKVLSVEGEVSSTGDSLTHIYLKTTLHAGSYPLDLSHTVIEITDGTHEANLYLDSDWIPPIYVVYNTSNDTFVYVGKQMPQASSYQNDYLINLTTFHIDQLDEIKVYNVSNGNWIEYTSTTVGDKNIEELKLEALMYAAKEFAESGISYTVIIIRDPNNYYDESTPNRVVGQGAIVKLVINVEGWNIGPQTHVTIKLMPKHGVPTLEEFWTPSTYSGQSYISLT